MITKQRGLHIDSNYN